MGKIRCIEMFTGNVRIQAERVKGGWYVWGANVTISEEELLRELKVMDSWNVMVSD